MEVIHSPDVARDFVLSLRADGKTIGLVPTMGALHEGHLSLVQLSQSCCDATVATVFVNPTQFGPDEDLDKYPRTLEQDAEMLRREGVKALFVPSQESMYPEGCSTMVQPPVVSRTLEGAFRPDHFRGVATVVLKLFHVLPCDRAVFGRKDYQQLKVIEAMTRDLNLGIEIVAGEIVREPDGLAMSSRNRYLTEADRKRALRLKKSLLNVESAARQGQHNVGELERLMQNTLRGSGSAASAIAPGGSLAAGEGGVDDIDYAVIVDADTLAPIVQLDRPAVALVAAHVGSTRLIDNQLILPDSHFPTDFERRSNSDD